MKFSWLIILQGTGIEVGLLLNFGSKPQTVRRVLTKDYLGRLNDADHAERR
jgi:hypothetical protein